MIKTIAKCGMCGKEWSEPPNEAKTFVNGDLKSFSWDCPCRPKLKANGVEAVAVTVGKEVWRCLTLKECSEEGALSRVSALPTALTATPSTNNPPAVPNFKSAMAILQLGRSMATTPASPVDSATAQRRMAALKAALK